MKNKKLFALLLAGVMATSLMTACGQGGGNDKPESKEPEGDTPASEAEKPEEGNAGSGEELTIWHYFEQEAEALDHVVEEYCKDKDVKMKATFVAREELMQQYTIGAVSGELPDIGMVDSPDMASYISLGVFEDITTELEDWGELDQFFPGPLSSCKDSEGKLYGLPNNSNCLAIVCNMELLEAAGVEKPTTWEEFEQACEKTTDPANSVYGFAMSAISNEEGTFQYIPWLYAAGGSVSTLGSEQAISSLDYLSNLAAKGYMSKEVVNWGQGDAQNAFTAGKAAMMEAGTWMIMGFADDIGDAFKYEFALMPSKEGSASVIGGENFGVCTGATDRETCIDFLKHMGTAEMNADWCEIAKKIPVRKDASELKTIWTEDPQMSVFVKQMETAVARGPHAEWPTISKAIYTAVQGAILGDKTAADAMKEAAAVVDPILVETPIAGAE